MRVIIHTTGTREYTRLLGPVISYAFFYITKSSIAKGYYFLFPNKFSNDIKHVKLRTLNLSV